MQRNRTVPILLAALGAALAAGCKNSNTLTGLRISPTATPPPALTLAGPWTGAARELGLTDDYFCPGRSFDVTTRITQAGGSVSFTLPSGAGCSQGGAATFEGTLSGTQLNGRLRKEVTGTSCVLEGSADGEVQASQLHLKGSLRGPCNAVGITIDLTRQ